jgi:hypothetical protein
VLKYLDLFDSKMSDRELLEQNLKKGIGRCLLLSDEDKVYWLENIPTFTDAFVEEAIRVVSAKNVIMDKYISDALADDSDHKYLSELKSRILKAKEKAFAIDEGTEEGKAEETLERQLNKI